MSRATRQRRRAARRVRRCVSPWPEGPHAALLRAALLSGEPALAAFRSWRAQADLDGLDHATFSLVPLLFRNLERNGADDPWMPILRGIHRRAWVANQVLFRRAADVLATLGACGVPTLVLKGVALVTQAYGDAGERPMHDVDVWVPAAEFPRALAALGAAGWRTSPLWIEECAADPVLFRNRQHAVSMRTAADARNLLDLHQDVFRIQHRYQVPIPERRFWDASEPCTVGGVATRRLAPHHQLLHVCFHGLQSQPVAPIRWVADADRLIRARAADLDWEALLADAHDLLLVVPLREALVHVAAQYGTPVPPRALESLRSAGDSIVERLERRLRQGDRGLAADYCASVVPLLRHARRPGTGFLRSLGAEHLRRIVWRIPWEHLRGWAGRE